MSKSVAPLRISVVGCGAVTEGFHLPVLAGHAGVVVTALVDPDTARAARLAALYKVPKIFASADELTRDIADAALLATPAFLHAPGSIALMQRGLHVLVEKPMALTLADAERMVAVARESGVVLTVGLFRRLLPAIRLMRSALDAGQIGELRRVDAEVGDTYTWQLTTMAGMQRERAGGGILVDMGPHVLDLLLYLCPGPPTLVEYLDNASTGIETDCEMTLRLLHGGVVVPARVELSRTRKLRNTIRIEGTHGVLEWKFGERSRVLVDPDRTLVDPQAVGLHPVVTESRWGDEIEQSGYEGFRAQIDDLVQAIAGTGASQLSGESVLPGVRLIEECYARRAPLDEPWFDQGLPRPTAVAARTETSRRVLVTGASGFIGTRLVERLHYGSDWRARALIRNPGRAARLARMPIEFAIGDLGTPDDLTKALEGCDAVVHAGIGTSWRESERIATTVQGTRALVDAAMRAGVKRFVHVSTLAVYGERVDGTITEETPINPKKGWDYAESKYAAEQIVLEAAAKGLPAVILRVAVVYGPYNMTIVTRPLEQLMQNRLVLVDCRDVPSNTIYVDNLCEGIRLALEAPAAVNGATFLLSDDDGFTWGDYYGYFASALGATVQYAGKSQPSAQEGAQPSPALLSRWLTSTRDVVTSSETKQLAKRIYNSDPWGTAARWFVDRYPEAVKAIAARVRPEEGLVYRPEPGPETPSPFMVDPIAARVSTAKAERVLGYRPVVDRHRAMALTLDWARYARIVPRLAHEEIAALVQG